jgi:hypothetical protein
MATAATINAMAIETCILKSLLLHTGAHQKARTIFYIEGFEATTCDMGLIVAIGRAGERAGLTAIWHLTLSMWVSDVENARRICDYRAPSFICEYVGCRTFIMYL